MLNCMGGSDEASLCSEVASREVPRRSQSGGWRIYKVVGSVKQNRAVGPGGFGLHGGQVPPHIYSIPRRGPSIRSSAPSSKIVPSVLEVLAFTVARFHHTSIRSHAGDHDGFSDSLLFCGGRPGAQSYVRSWLDQRYILEHPGMRTSPTEF